MKNTRLNWRIILIIFFVALMLLILGMMLSSGSELFDNGTVDLTQSKSVLLKGQWEFYWNKLLIPEDFTAEHKPQMDSFMNVPGSWDTGKAGNKTYPHSGVATYRLVVKYPLDIQDPALKIQNISTAYKLYANGELIAEVGKVSDKAEIFKNGEQLLILALPKDKQQIELIFQVANLQFAKGGIRKAPVFGSKQVFEQQKMTLLALQLFFIGCVFAFGIYYLLLFLLQQKNKTALFFSLLCFLTALRCLIWGEAPLSIFFPQVSYDLRAYINYFTGYNYIPSIILFVLSAFSLDYNKKILGLMLLPNLFFNALFITSPGFMSYFTKYLYLLMIIQMLYIICIISKAVICKEQNAILMFIAVCVLILTINQDILHYNGIGGVDLEYAFLYGNFAVVIAMSFVQARHQANTHKKLILYNEKLIEADRLKDKIMATEMSFLQAQIKPHFLYNALSAIANVCEKDGKKAGVLILDLAIYLRRSLQFNHVDKMVTIENALEFVDKYFNIEQARFGQKIQLIYQIEIPLDSQIPVLILQPLVENAVRHGVSKKTEGGTVYVRMKLTSEGSYIEIEDDGVGIDNEKLASLLTEDESSQGVGLRNINNRLLRLYGRGLDIISEAGHGTCVSFMILEGMRNNKA